MMNHSVFAAFASLFLLTAVYAAGEGTAVGVKPDAVSQSGGAQRVLVVGADVSVGDKVVTGPTGLVQLLFADQTRLVVGPGSALEIESYLLGGNGADRFAVNALAGTFRFISGISPKSAYSIDTPSASIAVRGTEFDMTVGGGRTYALLYQGALTQCQGDNCVDLQARCDIAVTGGRTADLLGWSDERHPAAAANFPLPNIQSALQREFRVSGAQACLSPPARGQDSGSSSEGTTNQPPQLQQQPPPQDQLR